MQGRVRPVGADWLTIRSDGVACRDVRATIETHDGALIYITYTGVLDLGPDGHANFLKGDMPRHVPIRTVPRLHCVHLDYLWVNRLQFLGIGEADFEQFSVHYDLYAVR